MSIQVCGPNEAMVKTGLCVGGGNGGRAVYTGGCTCYWPCFQELHRMELTVMTIKVHSSNVVTAEGVEITAEGLTQVRIDPGMAADQADAMICAKNEDIEHKVEEVIREKTLLNKSKQEEEVVKGVPGVTQVRVVTVTQDATACEVATRITPGKKRLAAFVGPPGVAVTEKVYAECHRRLKGSGMVPYWILAMPLSCTEVNYDLEMNKLGGDKMTHKERDDQHLSIQAAEKAYGKLTEKDHPTRKQVYDATGYWPGSMGPVQIFVVDSGGQKQSFMGSDFKVFHPSAEPGVGSTVGEVKQMLCDTSFVSPTGLAVRDRICTYRPDDVELVYLGKEENSYGNLVDCGHDMTATVKQAGASEPIETEHVTFTLFEAFVGFATPSIESTDLQRVHTALKLAECRVGPSRDDSPDDLDGLGGEFPFWVTDEQQRIIFAAEDERSQFEWIDKIETAIVNAQNMRREKATVRDAKRGNVLQDFKTLMDYKIEQGDCFALRRKPGLGAVRFQPVPEPEIGVHESKETTPLQTLDRPVSRAGRTAPGVVDDEMTDSQRKEEEMDSEAHEGDKEFKEKVTITRDMANLQRAASQFVSKSREEIINMVKETLEGHQRAIMAELTVDEIYKDRLMFQRKVRETADVDLAKMGLRVISYTLKDVSDANGYMMSLGVRRIEEVKKEARMGEAQEASEADQRCHLYTAQVTQKAKECEIEVNSSLKNFTMRQQEWKNEVTEAQQEAAMQSTLEVELQRKTIAELKGAVDATRVKWQTELGKLEKQRKELELTANENLLAEKSKEESNLVSEARTKAAILVAEADALQKTKIAQAEADVITKKGEAAAEVMEQKADAWMSYGEKSYVDMVVEQLPEIASNLVSPLNKIDKMVMINGEGDLGASKVTAEVSRVMTQVPDVVESLTGVQLKGMLAGIDD